MPNTSIHKSISLINAYMELVKKELQVIAKQLGKENGPSSASRKGHMDKVLAEGLAKREARIKRQMEKK